MSVTQTATKQGVSPEINQEVSKIFEEQATTLEEQIQQIASGKLKELFQQEAELKAEIDRLSSIGSEAGKMRLKEADLQTVRVDIAKRSEDLASLAYAMAAEMESFGQLSGTAFADNSDDIAMRTAATERLNNVQSALSRSQIELDLAKSEKTDAESLTQLPWILKGLNGRETKISAAQSKLKTASSDVSKNEVLLTEAQENIVVVEEQIQTNKRERLREASLLETYERISGWVTQAKNILKKDIAEYELRLAQTKKSKAEAIERRIIASGRISTARDMIASLNVKLLEKQSDQSDITDRTDTSYQKLEAEINDIVADLDYQNNELKLAESGFTDAEIAVKERNASIMALTAQAELAKHQFNKFVVTEESANIIGRNIEVLVKGGDRAIINESLDKAGHKMTIVVFDLSNKTAIAAARQLNNMKERNLEVLQHLGEIDQEADSVLAVELKRNAEISQRLREGYEKQGLDVEEMSSLSAAAEIAQQVGGAKEGVSVKDQLY